MEHCILIYTLYQDIMNDIAPAEIEEIYVTIKLSNRDTISPIGIVRDEGNMP